MQSWTRPVLLGFFIFISIYGYCQEIQPLTFSLFKKDWEKFLGQKQFDFKRANTETYSGYEFLLIKEYTRQQAYRQRAFNGFIDRHRKFQPYLENQVVLTTGTQMSASLIQLNNTESAYQKFIASQAPLKESVELFWQMILEQEINQIVMLTEFQDFNHYELAFPYWPLQLFESINFGNEIQITCIEKYDFPNGLEEFIEIRKLEVNFKGQNFLIKHYWYRNWLDNSVPRQPKIVMNLINTIMTDKKTLDKNIPILVHCSAGVGRTGVFILLYNLIEMEEKNESANLFYLTGYLRWQRAFMLSSISQYKFCQKMKKLIYHEMAE